MSNLHPSLKSTIETLRKQLDAANDDSEAFQAICTAFVVIAHDFNVDPHDWVRFTEKIRAEVAHSLANESKP